MSTVGKHIKARRVKLGLSQQQLAEKIFTTRQTISNYETGRSDPDVDTLVTLAEAMGTEVSALIYGEKKPAGKIPDRRGLTLALMLVVIVAVYIVAALLSLNREQRLENQWQSYEYTGTDPLSYVKAFNSQFGEAEMEYEVFEAEGVMIILSSVGDSYYFYPSETGDWERVHTPVPVDGVYYTAMPFGPCAYSSRLIDGAGNIYDPVYEARFAAGYLPVFALDVSAGQEYRCLLYGVDETGAARYERGEAVYSGFDDWSAHSGSRQPEAPQTAAAAAIAEAATGEGFLTAMEQWRKAIWSAAPVSESEGAALGIDGSFVLSVVWSWPPALILQKTGDTYIDFWELNEYNETLYDYSGGHGLYQAQRLWSADLTELTGTAVITPEMLQRAAASLSAEDNALSGDDLPYGHTWTWPVTVPDDLETLWCQICQELDDPA